MNCRSLRRMRAASLAGTAGLFALLAGILPTADAAAQVDTPIPQSLFDTGNQAESPQAEPLQAPTQPEASPRLPSLAAPLPPRRPAQLQTPVAPSAAADDSAPAETEAVFGKAYRSLDSSRFVPFRPPEPVGLAPPANLPQRAAQPAAAVAPAPSAPPPAAPSSPAPKAPPVDETLPEPAPDAMTLTIPQLEIPKDLPNIPLPPPAPADRTRSAPAVSTGAPPAAEVPPPPAMAAVSTLSDRQIVERANRYFNTLDTLQADFAQVGGEGKRMTGMLYVERPGRMRFVYDPPATMEIVSDGRSVAIRDSKLNTSDVYSINQTPLKFLVRDRIDLSSDLKVIDVEKDPTSIQITVEDSNTLGGKAQITLFFDQQMQNLTRWRILDAQGFVTTVILSNVQRTRRAG